MARLPETFNFGQFGDLKDLSNESLLLILERIYIDLARAINQKPDIYERDTDGQATDTFLANGSININLTTDNVEILTNHNATSVVWTQIS